MDKDSSTVVYLLCDCCFHEAWAGSAPQMDVVLDEIGSACVGFRAIWVKSLNEAMLKSFQKSTEVIISVKHSYYNCYANFRKKNFFFFFEIPIDVINGTKFHTNIIQLLDSQPQGLYTRDITPGSCVCPGQLEELFALVWL